MAGRSPKYSTTNTRAFFDSYSATGQRELLDASPLGPDDAIGLMRLDSLATEYIVVPDTHLFDGRLFLAQKPSQLAAEIGRGRRSRRLPIEVRVRSKGSLSESLRSLLVVKDRPNLNYFPFNSIAESDHRFALAQALSETSSGRLNDRLRYAESVPAGVAGLLRDLLAEMGRPTDIVDPLEDGWTWWIEEEKQLSVAPWGKNFRVAGALMQEVLMVRDLPTVAGQQLRSDVLTTVLKDERFGGKTLRGAISQRMREYEAGGARSAEELLDMRTVASWYERARHRAIAVQHGANLSWTLPYDVRPVGERSRLLAELELGELGSAPEQRRVELPDGFLNLVARMSGDAFAAVSMDARFDLRAWWQTGDVDALRRVVDCVFAAVDSQHAPPRVTRLTQLFSSTMAAAVGYFATQEVGLGSEVSIAVALVAALLPEIGKRLGKVSEEKPRRRVLEYLQDAAGEPP